MAFGSKKQTVVAKPSFKERLTGVKSMFKKAHKKQKVKLLEDEIGFISETQKETQEFMSNLEKFI